MRPKFSTGYLTPQSNRIKPSSKVKRSESSENLPKFGEISDDVLKKLMSCPIKKQLIIDLITSEKDNIDAYKKKLQKQNILPSSPIQKVLKKPCESPTALLRRRLEQQKNAVENREESTSSNGSRPGSRQSVASTVPSPVSFDKILEGVVAFVEVKSGDRDRSEGVKAVLASMGAAVRDKFTKDVTHVVFKDGSFTTYQKANLLKAKLVSVLWLEACKTNGIRVLEKDYPAIGAVGTHLYDHNQTVLCSQMQKEYEEIIREEFNRSIASGEPLPSVKSFIDRRRTIVTPNVSSIDHSDFAQDYEVAKIMRRTIHGPSRTNLTPESLCDDDSDTGAIVDGDTAEKEDRFFEDLMNQTHHKTSTVPQDMDLTDLHREISLTTSKEESLSIYNQNTPKVNKKISIVPDSHSKSPDIFNNGLYGRRTELFQERESPVIGRESQAEKTPSRSTNALFPTTVNVSKEQNCTETMKDVTNIPRTTKEQIALPVLALAEKSSSTMSSLRISDASEKINDSALRRSSKTESFNSKSSFSPLQPNIINNIFDELRQDNPAAKNHVTIRKRRGGNKSKKYTNNKDPSFCSSEIKDLSNSVEDLVLVTPEKKNVDNLTDHVTLRKKMMRQQVSKHLTDSENVAKNQIDCLSSSDENTKKTFSSEPKNNSDEISDMTSTKTDITQERAKTRRKTIAGTKRGNEIERAKDKRKTISTGTDNDRSEYKQDEETNKDDKINNATSLNNQNKENVNRVTTRNQQKVKSVNTSPSVRNKTCSDLKEVTPRKKLKTSLFNEIFIPLNETQETDIESKESSEMENPKNIKKGPESGSKKESGRESPTRMSKRHTSRRYTISCSRKNTTSNDIKKKTEKFNRSASVTDLTSTDSKNTRKLRKLYEPHNTQELNSDEREMEERRRAKKVSEPQSVFINPTIFLTALTKQVKENKDGSESASNDETSPETRTKKNTKKKKSDKIMVNCDNDEQIELKKLILGSKNQDKEISDSDVEKTPRKGTKSKLVENTPNIKKANSLIPTRKSQRFLKTPTTQRTQKNQTKLTIKLTPVTPVNNRRSTMEFQSVTSSAKKKFKIDRIKIPSIVCTKMHKGDVQVFTQIVRKLGRFNVEDEVTNKTTHLVAGEPKRTINMLRAIARGCWVLKREWKVEAYTEEVKESREEVKYEVTAKVEEVTIERLTEIQEITQENKGCRKRSEEEKMEVAEQNGDLQAEIQENEVKVKSERGKEVLQSVKENMDKEIKHLDVAVQEQVGICRKRFERGEILVKKVLEEMTREFQNTMDETLRENLKDSVIRWYMSKQNVVKDLDRCKCACLSFLGDIGDCYDSSKSNYYERGKVFG